ncbi:GNAT family N-acetyltransferase [Phormidium tenue]|uniref:GNAT family N-acetyltransferase n=1 Tax=Phormidium tenue NIES-30 TaxID=549789 RepID=A0A1U7JAB2_9CYAN|nr:GNAT family N-acetyltransferase [Phormidium tenue]MBD2230502.1 GNAT family N-acetyltransferase [Phormidium tenue FACHB-1052]OKH50718.1 GNAT family N-acetyltransferase [Phormidium tenue NIES-30]
MQVKDLTPAEWPWPLLLDADPSRSLIEAYIHQSTVMGLLAEESVIAVVVLLPRDRQVVEVMNIAVAPSHQGKKLGKLLLAAAVERSRQQGAKRMIVGTGTAGIGQLAFYQKMGFRMESIDRDYFVRHYPEPIYENGIWCRDRVILTLDL